MQWVFNELFVVGHWLTTVPLLAVSIVMPNNLDHILIVIL